MIDFYWIWLIKFDLIILTFVCSFLSSSIFFSFLSCALVPILIQSTCDFPFFRIFKTSARLPSATLIITTFDFADRHLSCVNISLHPSIDQSIDWFSFVLIVVIDLLSACHRLNCGLLLLIVVILPFLALLRHRLCLRSDSTCVVIRFALHQRNPLDPIHNANHQP